MGGLGVGMGVGGGMYFGVGTPSMTPQMTPWSTQNTPGYSSSVWSPGQGKQFNMKTLIYENEPKIFCPIKFKSKSCVVGSWLFKQITTQMY